MKIILVFIPALILFGCSGQNANEIKASGTVEATEVIVSAKVGGEVLKILVSEGSRIKKGDTLAIIDKSDLEIQLEQAKANVVAAEAQYKLAILGPREEDIAQAEATLKNAEDDLRRSEELFKEKSISQKQVEDVRTRYVLAKQAYDKLKRGLRPEEIEAAKGKLDVAIAQQRSIRKKIDDTYVIAPASGIITQKGIEEGETILPNASLFKISYLDKVFLMIYVSEVELAHIKLNQKANVYIDGMPEKAFPGTIVYTSPVAEFTPKNIQTKDDRTKLVFGVKIEISNPDHVLKAGMPADAVIGIFQNSNK